MKKTLALRNITKVYNSMQDRKALNDATICFCQGEFVSIVGKSGSGKSTMLNMLTCIDRPTEGEVLFDDEKLHEYNERQLTRWRGQNIGIVFQFFQLMPTLSILENIVLPMDINHCYPVKERKRIASELLERVGISECANKLPSEVSGGQQQRAAIARALANRPPFIIADEPTGNLDSAASESMMELFRELTREGTAVIMVTHNQELAGMTDRMVTICDGKIIGDEQNRGECDYEYKN